MTDLPDKKQAQDTLSKAWAAVTDEDLLIGKASYPSYHAALKNWARFYKIGFVQTVEAFAALSPNNDYHGNLRSLSSVLFSVAADIPFEMLTISTYRACGKRALDYVKGDVSFLDTVKGPKITAFRHNLLYPTTSQQVTIDGHMVAIWADQSGYTMKDAAKLMTASMYKNIERDVITLARSLELLPNVVQAALWISRKRQLGIKFSDQKDLFTSSTRWDEVATPEHYPPFQIERWRRWNKTKKEVSNV